MLLCGGVDAAGRALSDCWSLYLEDMRWELVETVSVASPVRRPLSFMCASEEEHDPSATQPELGRCTATWSFSLGAAVIWCNQGFWTWRTPDQMQASLSPHRHRAALPEKRSQRGDLKMGTQSSFKGAADLQTQWWEQQKEKMVGDESGQRWDRGVAANLTPLLDGAALSQVTFTDLPDVLPPARRWSQSGSSLCTPPLPRVQSEPKLHDSWRPAPSLIRGTGSQGSLLEPKSSMHGQIINDRSPLEPVQWHAKHGQSRLDALSPL